MVKQKMQEIKENPENCGGSLIENYLRNEKLGIEDIVGVACDALIGGIDGVYIELIN